MQDGRAGDVGLGRAPFTRLSPLEGLGRRDLNRMALESLLAVFAYELGIRRHVGVANRRRTIFLAAGTTTLTTDGPGFLFAIEALRVFARSLRIETCVGHWISCLIGR